MVLTWRDVETAVQQLNQMLEGKGCSPDGIIAIARGGWIPARLLAGYLGDVPLFSLYPPLPLTLSRLFDTCLIVDDCVETGRTLHTSCQSVRPMATRLYSVALFIRSDCAYVPDYYVAIVDEPISFPWRSTRLSR